MYLSGSFLSDLKKLSFFITGGNGRFRWFSGYTILPATEKISQLFVFFVRNSDNRGMIAEKTNSRKPEVKRRIGNAYVADSLGPVQATDKKVPELKKAFGKKLARIRREAGYSQTDLSLGTGMTRNFINELEQGVKGASFLTLTKLSVILRTPVHEFFEPEGKVPPVKELWDSVRLGHAAGQLHEVISAWDDNRTE
jgi:transcriptional regulator with XRE-family HTH domain